MFLSKAGSTSRVIINHFNIPTKSTKNNIFLSNIKKIENSNNTINNANSAYNTMLHRHYPKLTSPSLVRNIALPRCEDTIKNVGNFYGNPLHRPFSELVSPSLVRNLMLPSCDASNKIMDTAQSSVHSKTENNFVFKSSLLPTTTTAASQKSKLLLGNEKFNKIKNEYHQFASNATSSIMDFENTIKQDNSDMDNTFKYLTPDTNKKIINTIKSNNKEMKELIKDKITDSLKTLKKSINNAKSPDGIGNPRLDSLEKTAEAFAIRMQKRLEELS